MRGFPLAIALSIPLWLLIIAFVIGAWEAVGHVMSLLHI